MERHRVADAMLVTCTDEKNSAPAGRFLSSALFFWMYLPHLRHEIFFSLRRLVLLLPHGVGVGPQGEPGVVVSQHGGKGFDVCAVLAGRGGEGVAEVAEAKAFHAGAFQDALAESDNRIRVVRASGPGERTDWGRRAEPSKNQELIRW